ncbi:hypothetical protein COW36_15150 [bacterium (Candidatus Blackallbacteria) CG17_big_fil_post_rev_8_21_14_2_50_48_46]|uniref:NADH:quinone oxidoreductase/Mrp antiporter membrane subunit domain-containing protein n=1 Tax=bacterium (Candidatus Blackallbacteria) CG17_big_fil_post_rev_8_21_14_2_50_48_46 TaxID=2014261 RepID=A0A2M7G2K5_9BACT|nr:MAG: hypothetical protein COW64_11400 [bacterium (Candidatus Blackallbacteria) CG18_big_fil_WC_8_21_14_2_50_49_26]PIW16047.1 MAG: hypothetical protein COW36_15150 [bacterium (Candidatus Blackallbacteria) CG17_big_fil_post_rev_8_21_14_2_50_48_46]PIW50459.1 MAG: hypothetical protein COW20_02865 [bacterium (Candidatus Blackallbacteria) CG13_big_fil_rev_8_21_14_2_50_49_14]
MSELLENSISIIILIPVFMFVFSVFTRIKNSTNYSKTLTYIAISAQVLLFIGAIAVALLTWMNGDRDMQLFSWFQHAKVVYSLNMHVDRYASILLLMGVFLSGVISRFSLNYLAHEEGYYKFFINFYLMQIALYTLILTSNFYFVLIAWELLGLSSVFLISYYQGMRKTVSNSLFVLGVYKFCDLFLILALLTFHHEQHGFLVDVHVHGVSSFFLVSLIIATMGKSAIFPFSKWVPRAMEGPTTSSAIFYGALSIHAGIILLMKFRHIFAAHPRMNALILGLGLITAVYAMLKSRIQTDAKSMLAYATVVQVGLIYMEFALGWYPIVILHTLSNALLKTYQFIRTPSNIHHYHHLEKLNYQKFDPHGVHFEFLLPKPARTWAYRMVYHNFGLTLIWQLMLQPLKDFQSQLNRLVEGFAQSLIQRKLLTNQVLVFTFGVLGVLGLVKMEGLHWIDPISLAGFLLIFALLFSVISLRHSSISHYLIKIKTSYFLVSSSAILFFGDLAHFDAVIYFVTNLLSLLILDYFIQYLSQRLDLSDIRSYLGIGNRFKYINMIAISILLLLTFTPGFASFVIFDVILEDISEKSQALMLLFLIANTLNVYSVFKFIFKIIFGESQRYLDEYPDFSRSERLKLATLILPMIAMGFLPFLIFH